MNCLFPKCVSLGECQGHYVIYPKPHKWITIAQPSAVGQFVVDDSRLVLSSQHYYQRVEYSL